MEASFLMSLADRRVLFERLAGTTDPLGIGLVLAAERDPSFVLDLVERFGAHLTVRHARDLLEAGAAVATISPDTVVERGNPGRSWLRAGVARARGDHRGAADAAASAGHGEAADLRSFRELFCAKELAQVDDAASRERAWRHLRAAAFDAVDAATFVAIDTLRGRMAREGAPPCQKRLRVAVLGGVTLELIGPAIRAAALGRELDVELFVGGFGLYQQEIIAPDRELDAFAPEVVVLLVDARGLGLPEELSDPDRFVTEEADRLRSLWRRAMVRWGCTVLQTNYVLPAIDPYGGLSASMPGGRHRVLRHLDLALADAAAAEPGAHIIDAEQVASVLGKALWEDPVAWHSTKQAPGPAGVPVLAHRIASVLQAVVGLSAKCLVLDLDDTIWGGAVGDVGVEGIVLGGTPLGEAFLDFQRYLRGLAARGVAIAVCSKNDEEVARAPFRQHPEMVLRESDVAHFVANWRPKAENVRGIAQALNVGLDSLVLVDDDPLERELVRALLPEVRVIDLPADPANFAAAVSDSLAFETLTLTSEDRTRTASYRADIARTAVLEDAATVDELIASLAMTAELSPFREVDVPRLHQLVNKTNQFNLTTVRMSETDVRALIGRDDLETQSVRLRDRFGDYGLVAVLIGRVANDELRVEQWLMSCRVFGRRLEDVMIARAGEAARARGLARLVGEYRPTSKNREFRDLYLRLGFAVMETRADGSRLYRADAATAAERPLPAIKVIANDAKVATPAG